MARPRLLVFTRTAGYRHDSIPAAAEALSGLDGFAVRVTDRVDELTRCAGSGAVVFLSTTGTVLDRPARRALREYVEGGGGFAGIHAAADAEPDWPWFAELLGARFAGHPDGVQAAGARPVRGHPSTDVLPDPWSVTDEWYAFAEVRDDLRVLLRVDESSYRPGRFTMPGEHPQAWCRTVGAGRSWYTGLGHTRELWADPVFLAHVAGGIRWSCGPARGRG